MYSHFLLYYGRDIPKMQNTAKAANKKKKLRKIKEVNEDGRKTSFLGLIVKFFTESCYSK